MGDRTGMARGRIRPAIYFESPSGYVEMAPVEKGHGTELARHIYEVKYRPKNWEWREAETWPELTRLQDRLIEQEQRAARERRDALMMRYDAAKAKISDSMRQRMCSAETDPWERDFLRYWLAMHPQKRAEYEKRHSERTSYLFAVEMDSGTKIDDRMPAQDGEFWRGEAQQK